MNLAKIKLFGAMQTNMKYREERQELLAQNVANANTPGYDRKDLKPLNFREVYKSVDRSVVVNQTKPNHIAGNSGSGTNFASANSNAFEVTPTGNKVSLEQEIMEVTKNSLEYQKTTNLYRKMMQLFKTAIGDQQ
ncbi:MAG: flagellar basal body rod protein FlgB [Alphaproteobacteria bacterium CG11_big_fil_rev_8_21_14_0_20_44_7]|nr:MAG: flagellar basal body rod protein FlgB [Alphaproteobacteria bacterium CG11_big_fil_rev_8_21_14_0_20_44_7]